MIKITTDLEKLRIKLTQVKAIGKLSNYKEQLLAPIQKQVSSNFNNQQSGDGQKWQRLSPSAIAQKKKLGFSEQPLVRTGALQNAVNALTIQPVGQGKGLQIGLGGDSKVKRIAGFQQFGTKRIPSRPFLTLNVRLSELIANVIITNEIKQIKEKLSK
jgi:Phage virion morphogenesis family